MQQHFLIYVSKLGEKKEERKWEKQKMLDIRGKVEIEKEQKLGRREKLSEKNHFPEDHTVN